MSPPVEMSSHRGGARRRREHRCRSWGSGSNRWLRRQQSMRRVPTDRITVERHLDERLRRLVAAAEVAAAGAGGVSAVARATGVSRRAIRAGAKELKARGAAALAPGRVRRPGGGRKRTIDQDPTLVATWKS